MKKLSLFFEREQNLAIHFLVSIFVIIASIFFKLSIEEWGLILVMIINGSNNW